MTEVSWETKCIHIPSKCHLEQKRIGCPEPSLTHWRCKRDSVSKRIFRRNTGESVCRLGKRILSTSRYGLTLLFCWSRGSDWVIAYTFISSVAADVLARICGAKQLLSKPFKSRISMYMGLELCPRCFWSFGWVTVWSVNVLVYRLFFNVEAVHVS